MEIERYLKYELDFEEVESNKEQAPSLPFLPSGHYLEFVRGRWSIKILDTYSFQTTTKVGVFIQAKLPEKTISVFKGYIKANDIEQFKTILDSCTDILSGLQEDYSCEKVEIESQDNFYNSGFVHQYNIWEFNDLLSSSVPSGYNVLVPDEVPIEECIDFINGYILNIGSSNTSEIYSQRIGTFTSSYISHFNHVGVNVLDTDKEGRLFIEKNFVKDSTYGIRNLEDLYVVRLSLKSLIEDRTEEVVEFLKDIGLVEDIVVGRTIYQDVRISFVNAQKNNIEVHGTFSKLLKYYSKKFGPI